MKLNENKDFSQEVNELSHRLLSICQKISPQKLYISTWKGVDDILDNVAGVSLVNEEGKNIAQTVLVELDCHNYYLDLVKAVAEKVTQELQGEGFEVIIKSTI